MEHISIDRVFSTVHIVCGESNAGALRVGLGIENKVIGFPDFFAVGPIQNLHHDDGKQLRYEWLNDHLNYGENDWEEEYVSRTSATLAEIDGLNKDIPIVIWTAENSNEQTGFRYLIYLLQEKANDVYVINTTFAFQQLFNTPEWQCVDIHTGEVHPEKLNMIYEKKLPQPLTALERKQLEKEWITLADSTGVVRIWRENEIITVNIDYFDEFIVASAQHIHAHQSEKDFIKAARIIGDVYGQRANQVGDAFIEYRLRCLIDQGIFEIKGIPKAMRYYSVKLR